MADKKYCFPLPPKANSEMTLLIVSLNEHAKSRMPNSTLNKAINC